MRNADLVTAETCPACGSLDVRAVEPLWFLLELDRRGLRASDDDGLLHMEFACRECETHWR